MRFGRRELIRRAVTAVLVLPAAAKVLVEKTAEAAPARIVFDESDLLSGFAINQIPQPSQAGLMSISKLREQYLNQFLAYQELAESYSPKLTVTDSLKVWRNWAWGQLIEVTEAP